jgi:hypothetical protein
VGGPVFVAHAGGAECDDAHFRENAGLVDVDVGDTGQPSTQTDTSNIQEVEASLCLHGPEITHDIVPDGAPHFIVGLLDFAVLAGMFIHNLHKPCLLPAGDREYPATHSKQYWCT